MHGKEDNGNVLVTFTIAVTQYQRKQLLKEGFILARGGKSMRQEHAGIAHTPFTVRTWKLPTVIDSVSFDFIGIISSMWMSSVIIREERKPRPGGQKGLDSVYSLPRSTGSYWERQLLSFDGFYNCLTWTLLKLISIGWWAKIILKINLKVIISQFGYWYSFSLLIDIFAMD